MKAKRSIVRADIIRQLLTASIAMLALTLFACEDKEKKQTPAEAATETTSETQPSGNTDCPMKEGPPITTEAVFLSAELGGGAGFDSDFRLPSGDILSTVGDVTSRWKEEDLKEGDKVSITYMEIQTSDLTDFDNPAENVMVCVTNTVITSLKKIGGSAEAFKTVKIGNQTWMAENLNIETGNSKCYNDNPDNCKKYGRLYEFETAKKACPSGWKLPTNEEWQALVNFAGGNKVAGKKLKAKSGWNNNGNGTDEFGFSALPGGFCCGDDGFSAVGNYGHWWSDSDYDWTMGYDRETADGVDFDMGKYSVRCIQN